MPPTPVTSPFNSSYLEAVGKAQVVSATGNVAFDITELDVAGSDFSVSADGTTISILRAGLYHVNWAVNLAEAPTPMLFGLMENGQPSSAITTGTNGNYSSSALINVKASEVPYTIQLHNYGAAATLSEAVENTAASITIARFADGARV